MNERNTRSPVPLVNWQSDQWDLPIANKSTAIIKALPPQRFLVLVVDDSAVVRQRLCALLSEDPCVGGLSRAANGAQAWTLFQRLAPDAVLLDIHLPDSSGLEVLRRIKKATPSCLVIVLTNLEDAIFRQEAQRCGADHFLHKATEFERVVDILHQYASQLDSTPLLPLLEQCEPALRWLSDPKTAKSLSEA